MGCASSASEPKLSIEYIEKKLSSLITSQAKIITSIQEAREFYLGRSAFSDEKQLEADDIQRTQIDMPPRTQMTLQSRSTSRRVTLLSPTASAPSRAFTFKDHSNSLLTNTTFLKNLQGRSIVKQEDFTKYLAQIFQLQEQFEELESSYMRVIKAYFHGPVKQSESQQSQQPHIQSKKRKSNTSKSESSSLKYLCASKLIEACQHSHRRLKSYFEMMLTTEQKYALPDGYVVLHH